MFTVHDTAWSANMAAKKKSARAAATRKKPVAKRGAAKRTAKPKARSSARATSGQVKRQLVEAFQREHERTRKVLRALPADQSEMRPHPRAKNMRELAFMFVMEQGLLKRMLLGEQGGGMPPAPDRLDAIIEQFERGAGDLVATIQRMPDSAFEETIQFPIGPGPNGPTMGDWTKQAFAWFLLADQIHHRGQMSVYLRLAGGRVPAIYGPSGDEPWR